jgi:hypothetical protein
LSNLSDSLPSDDQQQKFTHKHLWQRSDWPEWKQSKYKQLN